MIVNYIYLVCYSIALLVLISTGLAVIFGMMKVINLAHGEFMMLGAYVNVLSVNAGAPLWAGFLLATLGVGLVGIVVERSMIRFLYGRIVDTLLATWGLSLFLVGLVTFAMGPQAVSLKSHFGTVSIAGSTFSAYSFILIEVAVGMLAFTWALARFTKVGLLVRGTMQDAKIASALGVNEGLVYMGTFGYGCAVAGLAGAVLSPITGASPTLGVSFVAKAFINVIVGGGLPLMGTAIASTLFGFVDGVVSYSRSSIAGEVAVLILAVVLLRKLPLGITGRFKRGL